VRRRARAGTTLTQQPAAARSAQRESNLRPALRDRPPIKVAANRVSGTHTPIRAPNANAYAERWVGTLRRECLDRILIVNRRHLEHVLRNYTAHYNRHRPHRSLSLQPPDQAPAVLVRAPAIHIHKREVLGGLINEYKAAA